MVRGLRALGPVLHNRRYATVTGNPQVVPPYERMAKTLAAVRDRMPRPLSLAEKILYSHLRDPTQDIVRGETYLKLAPDSVAMQDASAQMALLQFMLSGLKRVAVPSTIHCDHLIEAHRGAAADLEAGKTVNKEVFSFLESAAKAYGIGFWKPGSGIIHQIVLENYAAPGGLMLGTDSHTPNAGGLGMIAIGVGGADAVDAMADLPWELKAPKVIGVRLTGALDGWASAKDVILHLAGLLTVQGGTGHIIEYFGPGVESLSCTGMATICNMGAEVGATTSLFPYTARMGAYLRKTQRSHVADAAERHASLLLSADERVEYDRVVEIDLSKLEPHINGPFTPDASYPLSKFADAVSANGWPTKVSVGLIGSCTNSSYEDMSRAASIARQARDNGVRSSSQLLVTPGSEQIRATIERDGQQAALSAVGAEVLANACGPCIGQWKRTDPVEKNAPNAIVSSFNRNFRGRNDGNINTLNFLASPDIVMAMALAGDLRFDPRRQPLRRSDGSSFMLEPPTTVELPQLAFETGSSAAMYAGPVEDDAAGATVEVDPKSTRLQLLAPFGGWDGKELTDVRVLLRVKGKCTTDHISAAGPWLKYKGHLDNIAENTLIGALNAESGRVNHAINALAGAGGADGTIPEVARAYKAANVPWLVVADENYGEGSAREHAAMQPRHLGARIILARSFARIHETNLKKQGMLPLTFENKDDYERIGHGAVVETIGLSDLAPNSTLKIRVMPSDGQQPFEIAVKHTLSEDQILWFKHGSALNMIAAMR